jgi:hypothetical protein
MTVKDDRIADRLAVIRAERIGDPNRWDSSKTTSSRDRPDIARSSLVARRRASTRSCAMNQRGKIAAYDVSSVDAPATVLWTVRAAISITAQVIVAAMKPIIRKPVRSAMVCIPCRATQSDLPRRRSLQQ